MVVAGDSAVVVRDRLHAALLAYSGLAGIGYWVQWFADESARTSDDPAYLEHNRSFVLADAYLAGAALLAARQLWKGHPSAVPLGVATGSAMTFLGLLDLLYDLQHGTFSDRSSAARLETRGLHRRLRPRSRTRHHGSPMEGPSETRRLSNALPAAVRASA